MVTPLPLRLGQETGIRKRRTTQAITSASPLLLMSLLLTALTLAVPATVHLSNLILSTSLQFLVGQSVEWTAVQSPPLASARSILGAEREGISPLIIHFLSRMLLC